MDLPTPKIKRCADEAMELQWDPDAPGVMERTWHLPDGVVLHGPAPAQFGIKIQSGNNNQYRVRVVWNRLTLDWNSLTRVQIMASSLKPLLAALGTDLWALLEQPSQSLAA